MKTLVTTFMLAIGAIGFADEPGWSSEQRAAQRQAVVEATVTKIEKVRDQPAPKIVLMRAVLKVLDIDKGKELLGGSDSIEILFETSPLGAEYRCPTFPVLSVKQHGRFYLRFDEGLSKEKAFVLEMGRDVEPIPLDARAVLPELIKTLGKNPTFDGLARILGEPHEDIGSGIHEFVYRLDQGPSIVVRTSLDTKEILSVLRGEDRLYPTKAESGPRE